MPTHAHFEELCVLATSGQLSADESDVLNRHLAECNSCRSFLRDVRLISDQVIPRVLQISRDHRPVPAGMRERFLTRAAGKGVTIQAGPVAATANPSNEVETSHVVPQRFIWPGIAAGLLSPWQRWAFIGTVCAACFVLGLLVRAPYGPAKHRSSSEFVQQGTASLPSPSIGLGDGNIDRIRAISAERNQLAKRVTQLSGQLQSAEVEKERTISAMHEQVAIAKTNAERDRNDLLKQVAVLNTRTTELQSQLSAAHLQQSLADVELHDSRSKNVEYSARLDSLQTKLQNLEAAPLPDPNEVSGLVAARNLHIVDVYDSNSGGQRQRAFGRVFYVEGRSLVFYAYDLTGAYQKKNITFHLWGEKVGSKETTLSLGVLHNDDLQERRWALTCNDPGLLAKINSVYVTAESSGKQYDRPRGSRVLYAYFGSRPNHP